MVSRSSTPYRLLHAACFLVATVFSIYLSPITFAQESSLSKVVKRDGRSDCSVIYSNPRNRTIHCVNSLFDGGPIRLEAVYLASVTREQPPFGDYPIYDKDGHFRDMVPAIFSTVYNVSISDHIVPAGVYALYVVPTIGGWQLVLNKKIVRAGEQYDPAQEIGRFKLTQREARDPHPTELLIEFRPVQQRTRRPNHAVEMSFLWGDSDFYLVLAPI